MMFPSVIQVLQRDRNALARGAETGLGRLTTLVGASYFFVRTLFGIAAFTYAVFCQGSYGEGAARRRPFGFMHFYAQIETDQLPVLGTVLIRREEG